MLRLFYFHHTIYIRIVFFIYIAENWIKNSISTWKIRNMGYTRKKIAMKSLWCGIRHTVSEKYSLNNFFKWKTIRLNAIFGFTTSLFIITLNHLGILFLWQLGFRFYYCSHRGYFQRRSGKERKAQNFLQ